MSIKKQYILPEVVKTLGIQSTFVFHCIQYEWITPQTSEPEIVLDEEDLARLKLICELKQDFGVNDEAIPIILHLLDELYTVLDQVKKAA